ncbi:MAG: ABC transporter ATP-binding protein [Culicoidibacterales bacterium]
MFKNKQVWQEMAHSIQFLWTYVRRYRWYLIFVAILIIGSTYFQVIAPLLLGDSIDTLGAYIGASMQPHGDIDTAKTEFLYSLLWLALAFGLSTLTMLVQNILMSKVAGQSTNQMRTELFEKLTRVSLRFFDETNDGEVQSKFTNDIDNISMMMSQSLIQVISNLALLVGIVIMMLRENVTLALVTIIMTPIVVIFSSFVIRKAKSSVDQQQSCLGELNGYIDEQIAGQKVIISYGLEDETVRGFQQYNNNLNKNAIRGQIFSGILLPLIQGISLINTAIIIFWGSQLAIDGVITLGLLVAFVQYSQRFFQPLSQIASQYNSIQLALTGAYRVSQLFEQPDDVIQTQDAKPVSHLAGEVEFHDVSFGYTATKPVLHHLDFKVPKGAMVALVGATGSGKTTVMNILNRFYDVDKGEILIDGQNIKSFTLASLRKQIGIVLQESTVFSGTIADNIRYGKKDATQAEMIAAAKAADLHDFIESLEFGYDTYITNNTSVLSTGQKQLLSIARTMITNPDILVLDEATSNVDTVTEAKIQKAMDEVIQGRTSFVIAHRLKTILRADHIIVLDAGCIVEEGTHQQLVAKNGLYAEFYHNQFVQVGE